MSVPDDMTIADAVEFFWRLGIQIKIGTKELNPMREVAMKHHDSHGWGIVQDRETQDRNRECALAEALAAEHVVFGSLRRQIGEMRTLEAVHRLEIDALREQNTQLRERVDELERAGGQAGAAKPSRSRRASRKKK